MHYADVVSWTNVSNKLLNALILTLNKPFPFFVVWLGSENLMFHNAAVGHLQQQENQNTSTTKTVLTRTTVRKKGITAHYPHLINKADKTKT
jgi:hypothetical protein